MTFADVMTEARAINDLLPQSAEYVRRWNALEDRLLDLPEAEAFAIHEAAERESAHDLRAHMILTMLESERA